MRNGLLGAGVVVALTGALLGSAGCVRVTSIDIPHPLTHGGVVPNRVSNPNMESSNYYGLPPATFQDDASLVSVDAQQACFAVTLRSDGDHANLATLSGWRVFMRGDPSIENMSPVFGPAAPEAVQPMQGSVPRRQYAGTYTSCVRYSYGTQCSQQPRYITVRVPAIVNVVSGGGAVCFAHGGTVNRGTQQLTLHLDDPNNVSRRMAFRWHFTQ